MNLPAALVWGFGATVVLTTIMRGAQAFGHTRIDLPFLLGSIVTPDRDKAKAYGYVIHALNGWVFALVYVAAFETAGEAGILLGMLIGFVHGSFVLIAGMPVMPALHPRMATEGWGPEPGRQLEPPGNLGLNYGLSTPVVTLAAHLIYGAILGFFYPI
jgi:hypothetical protein